MRMALLERMPLELTQDSLGTASRKITFRAKLMTFSQPLTRYVHYCLWLSLCLLVMPLSICTVDAADVIAGNTTGLDAGEYHNCGLLEDGTLTCWGDNASGQATPPLGRFIAVSSGFDHSCALRGDGQAYCWGNPTSIATPPPTGPYIALSAGNTENCALRTDGQLLCWGGAMATAAPTTGTFLAVSVSAGRGCAIRSLGTLQCWQAAGVTSLGTVPTGRYLALSLGFGHACALRSDGKVRCWGSNTQGQTAAPTTPNFIAITSGYQHSCAIQENGTLSCWGSNASGQLNTPTGTFLAITAGRLHTCARNDEGTVQCWGGTNTRSELDKPTYNFQHLAVGRTQACGLVYEGDVSCIGAPSPLTPAVSRYNALSFSEQSACGLSVDGYAQCWGASLGTPPNEPLTTISLGGNHVCGLRPNGAAVCWGDNTFTQATPIDGVYSAIASGDRFTCALNGSGALVCWGQGAGVNNAPQGVFASLSVHGGNACVTDNSGYVQCWGVDAVALTPPNEQFSVLAVGGRHVCAIRQSGGALQCWGDNTQGQLQAPAGAVFYQIAAFGDLSCASDIARMVCWGSQALSKLSPSLRMSAGTITAGAAHSCTVHGNRGVGCWGSNTSGQRNVPIHQAQTISANADHTCSVRGDGQLQCWGDNTQNGSTPTTGAMRDLDIGQRNGCAVRGTGALACWGWNVNSQSTPPTGTFRSVATGLNHSCGLRDDGTIACWGYNADSQATAPVGQFKTVDVGERHSCAIAIDGSLLCWGLGTEGQTTPPNLPGATYRALTVGAFHNCAIISNGSIVCWGRNNRGQTTPPDEGKFTAIAAGTAHSCAVRDDGIRICWGDNDSGQAPTLSIGPAVFPQAINGSPFNVDLSLIGNNGYVPKGARYRFVAGALPNNIEINDFGQLRGVPFYDPGVYPFTIEASDENGFFARREMQLTLLAAAPEIEPVIIGVTRNGSGWYSSDVNITWNITSQGASVTTSGCQPVSVNYDTPGVQFRCVATNSTGTTERTVFIRRDATGPETAIVEGPPNNYGAITQRFVFSSPGTDLSGFSEYECSSSPIYPDSYFPCNSPFFFAAQTYPGDPGTFTLTVRAKDAAGNVDPTPSTYTWTILRDTTPPVVGPLVVGTIGDSNWYRSDVHIAWSINDPETPIVDIVGCTERDQTVDTTGTSEYCEARSWGFKNIVTTLIKRDVTAPTISAAPTTQANLAGWYRDPVTVAFSCGDATSGVVTCPGNQVLSQDGLSVSSTAQTLRDFAGNTASVAPLSFKIDRTPPVVGLQLSPSANANGWHKTDVTAQFTCSDALSGLAAACPAPVVVTQEGASISISRTITDIASNTTTAATTVYLDKTPPTILALVGVSPNSAGWYRSDVLVSFSCSDSLSGVNGSNCPNAQLLSQEGIAVSSQSQTTIDNAGNLSAQSNVVTVKIDKTAPVLSVTMPPSQLFLNAAHNFNLNATDTLSGIASQNCGAIDTSTLGNKTVVCTATDRAGNSVTRTASYRVVYDFVPLSAPLIDPNETYIVRAPRSVPLEWRVRDANGAPVVSAVLMQSTVTEVPCQSAGVPLLTEPTGETNSFDNFGDGRYRRNWWINYTGTVVCLRLDVLLNDGITHSATVRVIWKQMRTGGPQQAEPRTNSSAPASTLPAAPVKPANAAQRPAQHRARVKPLPKKHVDLHGDRK